MWLLRKEQPTEYVLLLFIEKRFRSTTWIASVSVQYLLKGKTINRLIIKENALWHGHAVFNIVSLTVVVTTALNAIITNAATLGSNFLAVIFSI